MPNDFVILTPDAQYDDGGVIEKETAGPGARFEIYREREGIAIPDASWQECDALLVWHEIKIGAEILDRLKRCRVIVRAGVGFDHIDIKEAAARGLPVCNTPDYGTSEVADHAIALMLAFTRGLVSYQRHMIDDPVKGFNFRLAPLVRRTRGRCLGIVGMGRIGLATALRAKGLGMDVTIYDPYLPRGQEIAAGVTRTDSLNTLLETSDVISLHAPLTETTEKLIGADALARMQPHAILVNTARGAIVDIDALHDALKAETIAAAALDVLPEEPPDPDGSLMRAFARQEDWIRDRLILTPHAAWTSPESRADARRLSTETTLLYLRHGNLRNCVNDHLLNSRH